MVTTSSMPSRGPALAGEGGRLRLRAPRLELAKEHDMSYGKITITVGASVNLEEWKAFTGAVSDEAALEQARKHLPGTAEFVRWFEPLEDVADLRVTTTAARG